MFWTSELFLFSHFKWLRVTAITDLIFRGTFEARNMVAVTVIFGLR